MLNIVFISYVQLNVRKKKFGSQPNKQGKIKSFLTKKNKPKQKYTPKQIILDTNAPIKTIPKKMVKIKKISSHFIQMIASNL